MRNFCMSCMEEITSNVTGSVCPHCGWNNANQQIKNALPYYTKLQNKYLIGKVKSANGEGFTYISFDEIQEKIVDIREFCPTTLVYRDKETNSIYPNEGFEIAFEDSFDEFACMTRALDKTQNIDGLVSVIDVFWENNTIYMVYEHNESVSLRHYCQNKPIPWETVKALFLPLINSLSAMHKIEILHLAITPDNLRVCKDGRLRLSEFSTSAARNAGTQLEADLTPGYSAIEQYSSRLSCSETTDIYGFTACIFFALTGNDPSDARKRIENSRLLISRDIVHTLPQNVIGALAGGLQVHQSDRIATFDRLRIELSVRPTVENEMEEAVIIKKLPKTNESVSRHWSVSPKVWLVASFIISIGIFYFLFNSMILENEFTITSVIDKFFDDNAVEVTEVITVPDLVGDAYNDWAYLVDDSQVYRFSIKIEELEYSEDVKAGRIISQTPEAGESLEKDGLVTVVVARDDDAQILPTVEGLPYSTALETLEDLGFEVVMEEGSSDTLGIGYVMYYELYEEGDELPYGTTVTLVVNYY